MKRHGTNSHLERTTMMKKLMGSVLIQILALTLCSSLHALTLKGRLFSVASNDDQFREIDPSTGVTLTNVSITLTSETVQGATGLARDPTTGTFYALLKLQSEPMNCGG